MTALNASMGDLINSQKRVDPAGFNRLSKAADANSKMFRDAAASTGLFETQQIRVNSATDDYVKKLNAQKLSFREIAKSRKVATAAYREQLAMENMIVRKNPSSAVHGKELFDVVYPKAYEQALDNAGNKLRWWNAQLKSGSHQMVNWGKNTQWAGRQLMVGFTMPMAAFGAAAGVMAYQVDKEFTRIAKVYDTHANKLTDLAGWEAETAQLRADGFDTARVAAKEYQATMTDTLEVQAELAATGKTGADLQKSTNEVMRIATLGEIDKNVATESAIALQAIWRQSNEELAESFNYMNAVENATSLQAADFTAAVPIAGAAVKAFGGDVKELGILLTAMKERGIGAVQGANALKATMQRLSRPSKQIQQEFQDLTGKSIVELVEGSSNLTEIFTKLNDITSKMSAPDKKKVFAGLFGSYQVTRLMAVTEGMGELEQGIGQVSAAAEVAGMSAGEMAAIAEGEIDALQKSVSGRFKSALEQVKIILAEMGEPFLEAATKILGGLAKIMNFINDLPSGIKKLMGWGAAVAAIAGPVVMMTGLFANLAGQAGKGIGGLIGIFAKFLGTMNIADKQTRIYTAAASMAESEHLKMTKAVGSLTTTMEKLVVAQQAANTASTKQAAAMGVTLKMTDRLKAREDARLQTLRETNLLQSKYAVADLTNVRSTGVPVTRFRDPETGAGLTYTDARAAAARDLAVRDAAHLEALAENEARSKAATAKATQQSAAAAVKQKRALVGGAAASSAMGLAMAGMMLPFGETTQNVLKWVMVGSVVLPAMKSLVAATAAAAAAASLYKKNMAASALAAERAALAQRMAAGGTVLPGPRGGKHKATGITALTGAFGRGGGLMKGVKSFGKGVVAVAGKTNLILGAVTAVLGGLWKWKKHTEKVAAEQEQVKKNAEAIATQTERWAAATGKAVDGYKRLPTTRLQGNQEAALADKIKFYRSDDEKEARDGYNEADELRKTIILRQKYMDLVQGAGLSQKEAMQEIQAFLFATGENLTVAGGIASQLRAAMGGLGEDAAGWAKIFNQSLGELDESTDLYLNFGDEADLATLKAGATTAGMAFTQAFMNGTKSQKAAYMHNLKEVIMKPWDDIIRNMTDADKSDMVSIVETVTGKTGDEATAEVERLMADGEKLRAFYMGLDTATRKDVLELMPGLEADIERVEQLERTIVGPIAGAFGVAGEGVDTYGELLDDAQYKASMLKSRIGEIVTVADQPIRLNTKLDVAQHEFEEFFREVMDGADFSFNSLKQLEEEHLELKGKSTNDMTGEEKQAHQQRLAQLEQLILYATVFANTLNTKVGTTPFETMKYLMNGVKGEAVDAKGKVDDLANGVDNLKDKTIKIDVIGNAMQAIRGGIQQDIADVLTSDFDARMQSSLDANQTYWDNRQAALEQSQQNASDALDAKWEKRKDGAEKYWDMRLEKIEKTIKAEEKAEDKRQKMFEAEMERIERLSNAKNTNIDFNVALNTGNLDEAAKIMNDMTATESEFALDKAAEASADASDKEIERLEKREALVEKHRDAAMKAMEKREAAEKKHLQKVQDMNKKSLDKQAEDSQKAKQAEWDTKKKSFDQQMELFLAFTARNEEELKTHMKQVGIGYDKFGEILKKKGTNWSTFMGDSMEHHIAKAALDLRQDSAWSQLSDASVRAMVKEMGFTGIGQFRNYVKTGEMADIKDNGPRNTSKSAGEGAAPGGGKKLPGPIPEMTHNGGWAGSGNQNRTGVARNLKGIHSSEVPILAQKGEFLVKKSVAAQNATLLETLNSTGKLPHDRATARANKRGIGGGGSLGGFAMGALARGLMFGMKKMFSKKHQAAQAAAAASKGVSTGAFPGKYVPGIGGWQKPSIPGLGWSNSHDYRAAIGTPIFAPSDGVITRSAAITSGGSPGNGLYATPYRSYGETIQMRMADGNLINFGHLSPGGRYVGAGQKVKGGSLIGRTGNTGNSTGPHLHMDIGGNYNASGYLASRGIPLDKGAANINVDGLPAILHKNEGVLTEDLNRKFKQGVDNFAAGPSVVYDIDINGEGLDTKGIVREVIREIDKKDGRKVQNRTIGNGRLPR